MGIILGRGDEAKKAIEGNGGGLDLSKVFIRLKAGQSRKVRILSKFDYVAYKAHGHFTNGINTTPCIKPMDERCLMCEAANYDGELVDGVTIGKVKQQNGNEVSEWASMYAKKRVLFAFVDLEDGEEGEDGKPEGMLRVFDATKNQADGLIATIDEYGDDLDMAFTFKRTGEKNETSYTLNPIMPKKMAEIQDTFDKWEGKEVPDSLFEEALPTLSTEDMAKELQKGGFPVKAALGFNVKASENEESESSKDEDEGTPTNGKEDISEDDLPL